MATRKHDATGTGQRKWSRIFFRAILSVTLILIGVVLFRAGWVFSDWNSAHAPIITTEGDIGYMTLISPAETDFLAINGITGEKVEFLPKSDMNVLDPSERYLFTTHEAGADAGLTRIDLETGETAVLLSSSDHDFNNLDGLIWTPWDTLLMSEERSGGRLFEVMDPLAGPHDVSFIERPAFGLRRHEGLAIDRFGNIYGVDEIPDGGIYRFRPDNPLSPASLSSGTLEVLYTESDVSDLADGRVTAEWRDVGEVEPAGFARPEDIEIARETLYVALTASDEVISIDLSDPDRPTIGLLASSDTNAPGLTEPDNLASDSAGNIYVVENIGTALISGRTNEMWLLSVSEDPLAEAESVTLVATLNSPRNEFSGIILDSSDRRLFVNVLGPDNFILVIHLDGVSTSESR